MRKVVLLIGLLVGYAYGQTTDCSHVSNTVKFYDNLRAIAGNVTEIHGNDITVVSKGKDRVQVGTYHISGDTEFYRRRPQAISEASCGILKENGLFQVTYCQHCRCAFTVCKMEGV